MKRLMNYFLKGLLVFVPVALTIFAFVWVFTQLDSLFGNLFRIKVPGLGLVITLVGITVIGFLASNFVGRKFFELIDKLFTRVPLVKLLYSSLKDFIEAFAGEKNPSSVSIAPKPAMPNPLAVVVKNSRRVRSSC